MVRLTGVGGRAAAAGFGQGKPVGLAPVPPGASAGATRSALFFWGSWPLPYGCPVVKHSNPVPCAGLGRTRRRPEWKTPCSPARARMALGVGTLLVRGYDGGVLGSAICLARFRLGLKPEGTVQN